MQIIIKNQFLLLITVLVIFLFFISIIIVVFIVKSRKKVYDKEIEKKDLELKFQKEILQKTILAQEDERKRIAQDLHDDISSNLTAILLNSYLLESDKTSINKKAVTIKKVIEITKSTIDSSRKIAHNLFPPVLEKFGLEQALEELVDMYNSSGQLQIRINNNCNFQLLNKQKNMHIFRILQELINNSVKHGEAKHIDIFFDDLNYCTYRDDGIGFDATKLDLNTGLGFSNIKNRIDDMNGSFVLNTFIGKGFEIKFNFN
ncbi:sensor histidine kinase [Aurantibacter aestuarii]|uniref:histidine kinase n=1 Tax=Aurantibacter aestuarii TaxID=1266046 RepID=A0A2T1NBD4_9FLAO|nr:ATP-binding protein [Aurantibacter aestuarii]PSG89425.1 two-component sensor histidine kinase [Aurantibacter aestuarii]